MSNEYTNQPGDVKFTVKSEDDFKQQSEFDTHTITLVNQDGAISDTFDEEQSASLYAGATRLTDIVIMNDIPGLSENLAVNDNILVGVPNNFSTALGNPNKLYVWFNDSDYYIFVYNPKNDTYMQLGSNISSSGGTPITNSQLNYVESAADVGDPTKYVPKTWVYYPQS